MKYLSLILLLSFITIVLSFSSCCNREGYDEHCYCYPGFVATTGGCGNLGEYCCRQPNGHVAKPLCKDTDGPCACYDGYAQVNEGGCSSVGGAPCCRHPNGHVYQPFCKKKTPSPPAPPSGKCVPNVPALAALGNPVIDGIASSDCKNYTTQASCGPIGTLCPACCVWQSSTSTPSPPPPTTHHPAPSPPHAPWNMNQHIAHIQNPIISHGEFNSPLPQQKATFLKRETLTPAPAPKQ